MSSSSSCGLNTEARVRMTLDIVNWDALSSLARELFHVKSSHWGEQMSGVNNIVRFLHLHDSHNTILVARVPLQSEEAVTPEHDFYMPVSKRIESEVATIQYVESHTNIPVPHVFHYNTRPEGDVRSAYILMSKVEGVALSSVWNGMDNAKRRIVLRQVVDILLELWSHRFDKKGVLFKRPHGGEGKDRWYIESASIYLSQNAIESRHRLVTTSYANAADYWSSYANAVLHDITDARFGCKVKTNIYAHAWFMRSLIPSLFDPSLDTHGYPLHPKDFNSQNIMITDIDTNPRITAIIDWELSGPNFSASFAQYPRFIVDHPELDKDHPLRKQNILDQATFDELMLEAERNHAVTDLPLSCLISNSYPIYLFEQAMYGFPLTYGVFYPHLFTYVFGSDEDISTDYYWALMEKGILRKETERFDKEHEVWLEAREVLGDSVVDINLKVAEFKHLVSKNLEKFDNAGSVLKWLASL